MRKKILIIQARPEDAAADNELEAFIEFGNLGIDEIHRVQLDREHMPHIDLNNYYSVIVGGGPLNVSNDPKSDMQKRLESELYLLLEQIVERDFPYLGACYGFGALIDQQDGIVSKEKYSEDVGAFDISLTDAGKNDPLLKAFPMTFRALGGHKEACQAVPAEMTVLAGSRDCPVQVVRLKNNIYATQFHPELDTKGIVLRINVYKNAGYFLPEEAEPLIERVKREKVFVPTQMLKAFIETYK